MIAFVIVLPSSIPAIAARATAAAQKTTGRSSFALPSFFSPPSGMAVVPTTEHQFPLGVVSWESASQHAHDRSFAAKQRLASLAEKLRQKTLQAENAAIKADIIQMLIRERSGEIQASEAWEKHKGRLDDASKKEISLWVHRTVNPDIIPFYFPDIPEPMSREEHARLAKTVEEYQEEVIAAKRELDEEQYGLRKKRGRETAGSQPVDLEPYFGDTANWLLF
jgi:hypothetical protein